MKRLVLLFTSCLLALAAPAQEASPMVVDSVRTLPLSAPIPSRGQLGGMAADRLGYLYVANFREGVWRVDPATGEAVRLTDALYGASGLAVMANGDLLQANFFGHTLSRIDRTGAVTPYAEGFAGPVGIALDDAGTAYVCNCSDNTLARVAPDGTVTPFSTSDLYACPNGITFDDEGRLFVVNFQNDHVLAVSPEGEARILATLPAGSNAHIAFLRGALYVTKLNTNQLYRVTPEGTVTLVAGTGAVGHDDGPALAATLARPNGITAGPGGQALYVNTLVGPRQTGAVTTVSVREIRLATLTDALRHALAKEGPEGMASAFRQYRSDPAHAHENTLAETDRFGYSLLSAYQMTAAIAAFQLNVEAYPEQGRPHHSLATAYMYAKQTDRAIEHFEHALARNPDNQNAADHLKRLRGE